MIPKIIEIQIIFTYSFTGQKPDTQYFVLKNKSLKEQLKKEIIRKLMHPTGVLFQSDEDNDNEDDGTNPPEKTA